MRRTNLKGPESLSARSQQRPICSSHTGISCGNNNRDGVNSDHELVQLAEGRAVDVQALKGRATGSAVCRGVMRMLGSEDGLDKVQLPEDKENEPLP